MTQLTSPSPPTREELWNHVVENIIMLSDTDLAFLKKKDINHMTHLFRYMTNLNGFNQRFPEDTPMVMNLRYFIMHCYTNGYKDFSLPLMRQTEESFDATDIMGLETDYAILLDNDRCETE